MRSSGRPSERDTRRLLGRRRHARFLRGRRLLSRFWRRTRDRLFLAFAAAFMLLATNQMLAAFLGASDERTPYTYVLRVLGFVLILYAIIDKNLSSSRKPRPS
jgi:hypothetical protein